jgi:hypothetical protein
MSGNRFAGVVDLILVFRSALAVSRQACAQNARTRYPTMASFNQYLMTDQNAEIVLARSQAPASISSDTTVLVLEKTDTRLQPMERMGSHAWLSARGCLQSTAPRSGVRRYFDRLFISRPRADDFSGHDQASEDGVGPAIQNADA